MTSSLEQFSSTHARLIEGLHARALERLPLLRGQLTQGTLAEALCRSVASRFREAPRPPTIAEIVSYLESLHIADLALASACAAGNETTWEHFITQFRPELYAAARAVAGESASRELADSLYADLYGLKEREGQRHSLFLYFHGRSKLSTWLRAILAQRHVDSIRASRRTVPLEAADCDGDSIPSDISTTGGFVGAPPFAASFAAKRGHSTHTDPDHARFLAVLQAALTAALAALEPRDRLRLCYYYVQDLTLAQIGRLLGEHEATVSRKLDRTRRDLRTAVERALREHKRLSDAQIQLCYEYAKEEWPFDLTKALSSKGDEESAPVAQVPSRRNRD